MKHGQHHLKGGLVHLLVHVDRDAASVVNDADGVVFLDGDIDTVSIAGKSLVDRVVHNLVDKMMKSAHGRVADIHRRAFAHSLQTLENLDIVRLIFLYLGLHVHLTFSLVVHIFCKHLFLGFNPQIYKKIPTSESKKNIDTQPESKEQADVSGKLDHVGCMYEEILFYSLYFLRIRAAL